MNKLRFLLLIFIIFLTPKVFAMEINVASKITATATGSQGKYQGEETYLYGQSSTYNINTRYNGRLDKIEFFLDSDDWDWNYNTTYKFTLNMATEDWRNNISQIRVMNAQSDGSVLSNATNHYISNSYRFISYKKITFNIKIGNSMSPKLKFTLYGGGSYITGTNNWNLSSIYISDTVSTTPTPAPVYTPVPTPTPQPNNQDIINNANQNTNNIINNQNENTQEIVNNANDNTSDIIDNANHNTEVLNESLNSMCKDTTLTITDELSMQKNAFLADNGAEVPQNGAFISRYIKLKPDTNYTIKRITGGTTPATFHYCTYNANKAVYHCYAMPTDNSSLTFTATNYATYLRVSYYGYRTVQIIGSICNDFTSERQQETTDAINQVNDTLNQTNQYLTDNTDPNISNNEFTSLFDSVTVNDPLSSLLQLPVQFINAIVSQSNSCQVVNLGTLMGVSITLPCIDIGSILGSTVWNTIDILSSIGLIVLILKQLYESITNALTLGGYMDAKKGGLGYMPPLEFLCDILTGFGGDRI